jgi:hypothetical protein
MVVALPCSSCNQQGGCFTDQDPEPRYLTLILGPHDLRNSIYNEDELVEKGALHTDEASEYFSAQWNRYEDKMHVAAVIEERIRLTCEVPIRRCNKCCTDMCGIRVPGYGMHFICRVCAVDMYNWQFLFDQTYNRQVRYRY